MDEKLWCLHVEGPDDIYAAPSLQAAEERAKALNAWWAEKIAAEPSPHWPSFKAVAKEWHYGAAEHAKDLPHWDEV